MARFEVFAAKIHVEAFWIATQCSAVVDTNVSGDLAASICDTV
jgi:hypothetical protein